MRKKDCPWIDYKDLPKEFKNKSIGKIFKIDNKYYGTVDALVKRYNWCINCSWHLPNEKKCYRCDSKLVYKYEYSVCNYKAEYCPVNRWGCSIHFRSERKHPFTCTCDECY